MDLTLILKKRYNNDTWTVDSNSYEGIEWLSNTAKPSEEELLSHWQDVLEELNAEKTARELAKSSAQAKLAALGLDADDLKALGL